jgi:Ca2+-transporting ATPase
MNMSDEESLLADPHAQPIAEVVRHLETDLSQGLTTAEAKRRLEAFGKNQLQELPPVPAWRRFLAQFTEAVIIVLIVAAIISGLLGEWIDTAAILAIVFLNGVLGFFQEQRAEKALAALQSMSSPSAKVVRQGKVVVVDSKDLVPGDRIELEAGDNVPADARLFESFGLLVQEAALTGESVPVEKVCEERLAANVAIGDRTNLVYASTMVTAGSGSAIVVGTGMETEIGRIAGLIQTTKPEPTPLQRRLSQLGKTLAVVCLGIVGVIFVLQLIRGGELAEVFLLSVSMAVAAIPEGLPAVVTLALALGLQRMVKRNALIRKLPSVETLGSVTVICSDKTGTLTRNEMTVREVFAGNAIVNVTGAGYRTEGDFRDAKGQPLPLVLKDPHLRRVLQIGTLCTTATLSEDGPNEYRVIGDPTEGALLVVALKAGIERRASDYTVVAKLPFDSERKRMSIVLQDAERTVMYAKGAPEAILTQCVAEYAKEQVVPLSEARRKEILQVNSEMAARALRVLAMAYREGLDPSHRNHEERELVFAGFCGMIDPPRDEVKEAVKRCHEAGIRPVMITGDHPATAIAIARELGIASESARPVTGPEIDATPEVEFGSLVENTRVYARVSAEHKLRIVRTWKERGHIVAMTGDGVNDAPAVKAADIGISMGITGTDVTKQASAMVLMDDNFASIVNAVEEGRGIFANIQKFLHYLLSSNTSEVLFMLFASLVGWRIPLLPIQILWINLVTDSLPALGLGVEGPEPDVMQQKPRPPREPVITAAAGMRMLLHGSLMALVTGIGFWLYRGNDEEHFAVARTVAFAVLAFAQLFFAFSCRSHRYTLPQLGLFTNVPILVAIAISGFLQFTVVVLPFANPIFGTVPLSLNDWGVVLLLALAPVTLIEVGKLIFLRPKAP